VIILSVIPGGGGGVALMQTYHNTCNNKILTRRLFRRIFFNAQHIPV